MKNPSPLRSFAVMLVTVPALLVSMASVADDDNNQSTESDSKRCISLARIDSTHVLDDSNILFYMLGKKVYRNQLPHRCPGLARADSFMYKTSLSQLCNLDSITPLDNMGFGFIQGPSCGLGKFSPIDSERAKELKGQKAPGSERLEPDKH